MICRNQVLERLETGSRQKNETHYIFNIYAVTSPHDKVLICESARQNVLWTLEFNGETDMRMMTITNRFSL